VLAATVNGTLGHSVLLIGLVCATFGALATIPILFLQQIAYIQDNCRSMNRDNPGGRGQLVSHQTRPELLKKFQIQMLIPLGRLPELCDQTLDSGIQRHAKNYS